MKFLMIIMLCFGLMSCDNKPKYTIMWDYDCRGNEVVVDKMNECIKNGNNMSDEEMEAVVWACNRATSILVCKRSPAWFGRYALFYAWVDEIDDPNVGVN